MCCCEAEVKIWAQVQKQIYVIPNRSEFHREMAPFTVSHANCLSVLAALLCAAPSSDIGAKPSGVQRGGSVAMWQACFRGKHHPQRAAV